jgi:hypothetical protein
VDLSRGEPSAAVTHCASAERPALSARPWSDLSAVVAAPARPGEHAAMPSTTAPFRTFSRAALFVSLLVTIAAGCDSCCTEDPVVGTREAVCVLDTACSDGDEFRYGACDLGGCSTDGDCCPGSRCRTDINSCFPRLLDSDFDCETSEDCPDPAQACATVSIGGREPLPVCIYESCAGDIDCGFGRSCYGGHCVAGAPCGGSCPAGTICELSTGSCHELPAEGRVDANGLPAVDDSCRQECTNGLLVLTDEASMTGEVCCALSCECRTLPPIIPTRIGRFPRVTVTTTTALVSTYDAEFGDLAVVRYDLTGKQTGIDYVDGVPDAPPTADTRGARRGIREPGADVGTHTSIVADGTGLARVAYHDVDNNALKVALEGPAGVWSSHVVDTAADAARGQTGTFTDIAIGSDGRLYVSYLAHDTSIVGVDGAATGVKLARSRTSAPAAAGDWEVFTVDARALVVDPTARPETPEMPRGRGVHTSITLDGDAALIAYYDGGEGDVRVARFAGSEAALGVLDGDGQGGRLNGDIGRFPTLAVRGDELIVVYEDFTRHTLRFWKGPKATPGAEGAYGIADQVREPQRSGSHFVGAGARLDASGPKPVLVYQDASALDLRFSTFSVDAFTPSTVLTEGPHGFYSDVAVLGGNAYVCSVFAELDSRGKERSRLRLDVQPINP